MAGTWAVAVALIGLAWKVNGRLAGRMSRTVLVASHGGLVVLTIVLLVVLAVRTWA